MLHPLAAFTDSMRTCKAVLRRKKDARPRRAELLKAGAESNPALAPAPAPAPVQKAKWFSTLRCGLPDIARHVTQRILDDRSFNYIASLTWRAISARPYALRHLRIRHRK